MKTLSKLVSTSSVSLLVITSPVLISSNHKKIDVSTSTAVVAATYHIPVLTNNNFKNFKYTSPEINAAAAEKVISIDKTLDMEVEFFTGSIRTLERNFISLGKFQPRTIGTTNQEKIVQIRN